MQTPSTIVKVSIGPGKISKFYYQQSNENSLVVIFPDENYSTDRPLLYYARKAALTEGHDVLCISYKCKLTWRDMGVYTIDLEADSSLDTIKKCLRKEYKNIFFISKGIGTEVAGLYRRDLDMKKLEMSF